MGRITLTRPTMVCFPRPPTGLPDLFVEQIDLPCQARPPVLGVWVVRPFERSHEVPHLGLPPGLQGLNLACHLAPPNIQKFRDANATLTLRTNAPPLAWSVRSRVIQA